MTPTAAWQDTKARYLPAALAALRGRLEKRTLAPQVSAPTENLSFTATLGAGPYYVRLRVDGVDSKRVNRSVTPPMFDPTQRVTIT